MPLPQKIDQFIRQSKSSLLLFLIIVLFFFLIIELVNYLIIVNSDYYYVWPPNLNKQFQPKSVITPGIEGMSTFSINKLGYRGALIETDDEEYRILTIGGSTTECLYLDDKETWPYLLMTSLNKTNDGKRVVTLNVGKSGHSLDQHYLQLKHLTEQYSPDLIIIMVGVNDMIKPLLQEDWKYENISDIDYTKAFYYSPHYTYRQSISYKILQIFYRVFILKIKPQDSLGNFYLEMRKKREHAEEISNIPSYEENLEYYTNRLDYIINLSRTQKVKLLLVTQPFLWKEKMSAEEEKTLWMVVNPRNEYYSPKVMAFLMRRYNQELLKKCDLNKDILCMDLDKKLPKKLDFFYDDIHFNEAGAKTISDELSKKIQQEITIFFQ